MKRSYQTTLLALTAILMTSMVCLPGAARASEEGRRNTALGLGAASVALLLSQKNKLAGIVTGLGAAYAYKRYDDQIRGRHRRAREYGYSVPNRYYGRNARLHRTYRNR